MTGERALWTWVVIYGAAAAVATVAVSVLRPVLGWLTVPVLVVAVRGAVALWMARRDARRLAAIRRALVDG